MQGWEGDEVGFVVGFEAVDGVTDLFDVNCAGKGCFLSIVALELEQRTLVWLGLHGKNVIPERHVCRW